jgi:hypothetical protein
MRTSRARRPRQIVTRRDRRAPDAILVVGEQGRDSIERRRQIRESFHDSQARVVKARRR